MTHPTQTYLSYVVLIFSLLITPLHVAAQYDNAPADRSQNVLPPRTPNKGKYIEQPKDSTRLLKGFELTYNLAGTILRMAGSYGEYEGHFRVNLKDRFFPAFELGYGDGDRETDELTGISVKSKAMFFRVGCDYNIIKNKHAWYKVTAGIRYGFTSFGFQSDADVIDPVYGTPTHYSIDESGLSYHWAEVVLTASARIWGPLHLGWSFRYKAPLVEKLGGQSEVWYIPGFGEYGNKIGATFDIGVEL